MKNTIFIFFLFIGQIYAQSNHLTFKNIPINGTQASFIEKMKKDGFVLDEIIDNVAIMKGSFVGKDCEIFIGASPISKIVWKVSVHLPEESNWYSLKSSYNSFKEQFSKKYGNPFKTFEFFSKPYYEGDGYEMQALRNEKCFYYTYWDNIDGIISIEISSYENIKFSYEDKINVQINKTEKSQNIQDDI